MPGPYIVTCGSGGIVTSCFTLDKPARALAVFAPASHSTSDVRVDFATTSGAGGTGDAFTTLFRPDGSGLFFSVFSGANARVGVVPFLPSPFGRLSFVSSQVGVASYTIVPL